MKSTRLNLALPTNLVQALSVDAEKRFRRLPDYIRDILIASLDPKTPPTNNRAALAASKPIAVYARKKIAAEIIERRKPLDIYLQRQLARFDKTYPEIPGIIYNDFWDDAAQCARPLVRYLPAFAEFWVEYDRFGEMLVRVNRRGELVDEAELVIQFDTDDLTPLQFTEAEEQAARERARKDYEARFAMHGAEILAIPKP